MRTSFCIYRRIYRQNTGYNYQIRAIDARSGLFGVILPDGGFHFPALFSLIIPIFRGRNQRFIKKCTLLWTIAGYRPQCKFSSEVSRNCRCLFARQIFNIFGQRLIYISAMFVLGAIFHETGLVWAQPMADALSLLLAAGLYFRISSKAYIKWRRVAATGIKAALIHQRFMVSAFDSLAVAHRDKQAGGQAVRGHEACPWSAAASDRR